MQRDHGSDLYQLSHYPARVPRWKRTTDICCGIAALPLLALLSFVFGVVSLTIARGPIFFCEEKIGYRGRRIRLYRFRTLHVRSSGTIEWARRGALALIPGGQFLRYSGLAGLPQVINVLRGEMSVVGPRPLPGQPAALANASGLTTLPGLTGLWCVSQRGAHSADELAQLDQRYAASQSMWADSKIILQTIPLIVRNVMQVWSARAAEDRARGNASSPSASLRTPSQQPW